MLIHLGDIRFIQKKVWGAPQKAIIRRCSLKKYRLYLLKIWLHLIVLYLCGQQFLF